MTTDGIGTGRSLHSVRDRTPAYPNRDSNVVLECATRCRAVRYPPRNVTDRAAHDICSRERPMRHLVLAFWLSAFAFLGIRTARADDAGPGICPETSYGMPCDPGDGNACGGVCLPDFSKASAPMSCLVANAAALARLTSPFGSLTSLDGIGCSPTGFPGTDCAHACSGGVCVAKNASQGSACMPATDDSGISRIPISVCSGACDGNGACVVLNQPCERYGRGLIDDCGYTACNVAASAPILDANVFSPGCIEFPNPSGVACSSGDPCLSGGTCDSQGDCLGRSRICAEPDVDGSAASGSAQDGDSPHATAVGGVDAATSNASAPASSSSSGCATAAERSNTTSICAFFFSLAIGASLRRSGSRRS
jgi:hypothetical protein